MFQKFSNFQIFKFQNFKKYSQIRVATSISDAFIMKHLPSSLQLKDDPHNTFQPVKSFEWQNAVQI